ncbi:hypothetical protein B566_EDAN014327 [Ephemera danica]|nr:hypothetical protein B566_EDAN014327 [Ephemera danica]
MICLFVLPLACIAGRLQEFQRKEEMTQTLMLQLETENRDLRLRLASVATCSSTAAAARHQLEMVAELQHELELPPASLFTLERVFPAEPGQGGRMVEKVRGPRRADLPLVVQQATSLLQENHIQVTEDDFVEGTVLLEAATGMQFQLIFQNKTNGEYLKTTVLRPFSPFELYGVQKQDAPKQLIDIILPLAGRIDSFRTFMERFYRLFMYDGHIALTIVYFGSAQLDQLEQIVGKYTPHLTPRLLLLNESFSRAKALRVGATHCSPGALLFFCDVDVVFTSRFLERCRWNTVRGHQVYYPIVFSLYNPRVVYLLHGKRVPPEPQQLVISKDTGFWRDFGYGMTCQYRYHTTWGGEDVRLYRKFLQQVRVLRATDPGLFHVWHAKQCSVSQMTPAQYRACLHSRARTEAAHAQLGLLAFANLPHY